MSTDVQHALLTVWQTRQNGAGVACRCGKVFRGHTYPEVRNKLDKHLGSPTAS